MSTITSESALTKSQTKTYGPKPIAGYGSRANITACVRFDDSCGNGYNTFAITGEIRVTGRRDVEACGMLHTEIAKHFPELAPLLKWHLCSTDGPIHYIENTMYWLGRRGLTEGTRDVPNIEQARRSAIWPSMSEDFILGRVLNLSNDKVEKMLADRLDSLLRDFRMAVESIGMVW